MKTKVIIIDNNDLSNIDFAFLSKPFEIQFRDANIVKLPGVHRGWLGYELSTALADGFDEVLCIPIGATCVDLLSIRQAALASNAAMVVSGFNRGPNDKFFDIGNYFAYLNLDFYRSKNITLDWGTALVDDLGISVPNVIQTTQTLTLNQGIDTTHACGPGWILLIITLRNDGLILNYQVDIENDMTVVTDATVQMLPPAEAHLPIISKWMNHLKSICLIKSMTTADLGNIQSTFADPSTPVENLYTTADSLSALEIELSYSNKCRVVFFSASIENINWVKLIIATWNGTNTNELLVPESYKVTLHNLAARADFFDTVWAKLTKGYIDYFDINQNDLIDDLATQKHVNNFIFLGTYSESIRSFLISSVDTASSETCYSYEDGYSIEQKFVTGPYVQDLYTKFRITYRNTQTGLQVPTDYLIQPHFLAQKWARALRYDYLENVKNKVEKNYMLQHWEYDDSNPNGRSLTQLCIELNRYVDYINNYFNGSTNRRINYHITQFFDPATIDQQILNEIHHHFEMLIGQVWSVSEYYKLADPATCFAIRQLNNLCHEMESLLRPNFRTAAEWAAAVYFPFVRVTRYKFIDSDYDHFTQIQDFGDIVLHYSQLGKTPLEAFSSNDSEVFDDNITGLRYLSGEFDIVFRTDVSYEKQLTTIARRCATAFPWIRARGQDPESKYTGIGYVTICKLDRTLFPNMSAEQIMATLVNCDDIYKLELINSVNNTIKESVLDYTWRDVLAMTDPTHPNYIGEIKW
jgi:hypothetical protein